jgi:SAM-dependent methyltransferase
MYRTVPTLIDESATMATIPTQSILRLALYQALRPVLAREAPGEVLSISGAEGLVALLAPGDRHVATTEYPAVRMEDLPFPTSSFDMVLSDQVLEHVEDPWGAVRESFRVVRPGGVVVHTTCFLNPVHADPVDFWRFTPEALRLLCAPHHVEVAAGWGNRAALVLVLFGRRRLPIGPVLGSLAVRLARRSDPRCPLVVWVVARKAALP